MTAISSVLIDNIFHCLSTQASRMAGFKTKLIAIITLSIKTLSNILEMEFDKAMVL